MAYFVLIISALSWSSLYILARLLNNANYIDISFFRFLFGFVCFLPIFFVMKRKEKIKIFSHDFFWIIGIVIINGIASTGMALASKYTNASVNSIFFTLNPLFVALFAPYLVKEKNRLINYFGIIFALAGVLLIMTEGGKITNFWQVKTFYSLLLGLFFDGVLIGFATNIIKKYLIKYGPWTITFYSMVANSIFLGIIVLICGSIFEVFSYSLHQWLWLFLIGLLPTAIAFSTFYYGLRMIGASKAAVFKLLTPVFSILLAVFLLNEPFSWYIIVGGLITISGLYLTQKK